NYSNPDVKFKGKGTGVKNERNNAAQLSAMGCIIADYRDFTPPLSVTISGPSVGDNSSNYTWCVNIFNCPNPASIVWEYSLDGFDFYTIATNELCVIASLPFFSSLWMRVT
ncbi:hypothetical protein RZS08_49875, partial [Arthrospira platensis SPKY1]|nr:hypothetical protein [Arthrospira platensis SPKY1]